MESRLSKDKEFYLLLWRLSIPLFFQQLLRISVSTLNSIMLGRVDALQMAAAAQADQVFFIYYTACSGLSYGASVLVSQYWGKKDTEAIRTISAIAIRIMAIAGSIFALCVWLFPAAFMRLYSADASLIAYGKSYLRIVSLMYPLCGISVMIFALSRSVEQVKIALFSNIVSYSANILLNYFLVYGKAGFPAMGISGVAIGTVCARVLEVLIAGSFFLKDEAIPFALEDINRSDSALRKSLLVTTAAILGHELVWALGTSSGSMILGQLGSDAVAGYHITTVLYDLFGTVGIGFSSACSVAIGMTLGKGEKEEAIRQSRSILLIAAVLGVLCGVGTWIVRQPFIHIYALSLEAQSYASQFMGVIALIWPFSCLEMVTMVAILRAGGDGKIGFYTDIVVMWCLCIPLAALAAFVWHLKPLIVVTIVKFIIVLEAIVGIIRVYSNKWVRDLTGNE